MRPTNLELRLARVRRGELFITTWVERLLFGVLGVAIYEVGRAFLLG